MRVLAEALGRSYIETALDSYVPVNSLLKVSKKKKEKRLMLR